MAHERPSDRDPPPADLPAIGHNCYHKAFEQRPELASSSVPAIVEPIDSDRGKVEHRIVSYQELLEGVHRIGSALTRLGVRPGDRVLILVPMSVELYQAILATMKIGAVCLFIDPADGVGNMERSAASMQPRAFIGVPRAHLLRLVSRAVRRIPLQISTWPTMLGWTRPWGKLLELGSPDCPTAPVLPGDPAMISFTSGSSGTPKGVCRTHADMRAIFSMLCGHEGKQLLGVNLCAFPVLPLDDLSFGRTSLLPRARAGKMAEAEPAELADQMRQFPPTLVSAPPGILRALADHCKRSGERFPSVRHVFTGGGVVPIGLVRDVAAAWPEAEMHVLYGSTEAEPVSMIGAAEILAETARRTEEGEGMCVGRIAPHTLVRIVEASDAPLTGLTPALGIGEIVVSGPHVNRAYFRDEAATRRHKFHDETDGRWWHRMGDLGFLDANGRLWLAGRLSNRVETPEETLYPAKVEPVFDCQPGVRKTALIGVTVVISGEPRTVSALLVEFDSGETDRALRLEQMRELSRFRGLRIQAVLECERVLYDPRIGAKIQYGALAEKYGPPVRALLGDALESRMALYRRERFPLPAHAAIALVFTLGIGGAANAAWTSHWLGLGVAWLVVLGFFWHLRVFDEQKDLVRDRALHPERPLPRGIVTPAELTRSAAIVMAGQAVGSAVLGPITFAWWCFAVAWSLLMRVEFFAGAFLRSQLLFYGASHSFVAFFLAQFVAAAAGARPPLASVGLLAAALGWIAEAARKLEIERPGTGFVRPEPASPARPTTAVLGPKDCGAEFSLSVRPERSEPFDCAQDMLASQVEGWTERAAIRPESVEGRTPAALPFPGEADESYARELGAGGVSALIGSLFTVALASGLLTPAAFSAAWKPTALAASALAGGLSALWFLAAPSTSRGKQVERICALAALAAYITLAL